MNEELVEMLNAAETSGIENTEGVLREDQFVDVNRERCLKASREMYSVLARYTSSESSTSSREIVMQKNNKDCPHLLVQQLFNF